MAELKRIRTCINCGRKDQKTQFARIVRTSDGSVFLDETGRMAGRGAYVCSVQCLEDACKKKRLAHSLKTAIDEKTATEIVLKLKQQTNAAC